MMTLMNKAAAMITQPSDDVITAPLHLSVPQMQTMAACPSTVLVSQPSDPE